MNRAALPLVLLTVVALLAVGSLAPATAASPQPSPVCGFCGDGFERTAEDHGVNATVTESQVRVQVHEDGSATWTVWNRLGNGSDRFRGSPELLADVGRSMAEHPPGVAEEATFVSAEMDDDLAVLVYRDPAAAQRHAGLLVVDYLHHEGYEQWYVVDADAFAIRGPSGTVVTNDPESGVVDGREVTWQGSSAGAMYEAPRLEGYPYVVFGPDRSAVTSARTTGALALASAPLIGERVQSFLLVQGTLFALGLALVGAAVRRRRPSVGVRTLAAGVAGIGGVAAVAIAVAFGVTSVPIPAAFGVLLGALAWYPVTRRHLRTPRRQALVVAGALAAIWAVLTVVSAAAGTSGEPADVAVRSTALALPFAAMLPLGGVLDADRRRVLRWGGGAVLAFVAMVALVVDFTAPFAGFGAGLAMIAALLAAVVFPVVGALVVVLGWRLSEVRPPSDEPARGPDDL